MPTVSASRDFCAMTWPRIAPAPRRRRSHLEPEGFAGGGVGPRGRLLSVGRSPHTHGTVEAGEGRAPVRAARGFLAAAVQARDQDPGAGNRLARGRAQHRDLQRAGRPRRLGALVGGTATPAPPIGPALGAAGVNPGQFIQQFKDRTKDLGGKVVGVIVTVYNDRSFDFEIKSSPAAVLIRDAAGVEKGSGEPNTNKVGTITPDQVRAIAEEKLADLNAGTIESASRMIEGTARSMGITVEGS